MLTIRFNPDAYTRNGETIRSCWTTDGNGILRVSKKNEKERQRSEAAIEEERQRSEAAITTQTANTIRLIREHDLLSNRQAHEVGVPGKFVDYNPEYLRLYLIRLLKSLLSTRFVHERRGCRRD